MSVYVRELLFDLYESHRMSLEERCDVEQALRTLLQQQEITRKHIWLLRLYLSGYHISELEQIDVHARSLLLTVLNGIERETNYRDAHVIDMGLARFPNLARIRAAFLRKAAELSLDLERYDVAHS